MNSHKYKPVITERDLDLFRDLLDSRVMTRAQICARHFDGCSEYTKKRVQKLLSAGYLSERKSKHSPGKYLPSMLSLARPGFVALAEDPVVRATQMSWDELRERLDLAEITLAHELEVVDMKVAFSNAIRSAASLSLDEFSTFPQRFQFETAHLERGDLFMLKPDGYARVSHQATGERAFFFEWDRSTEAHRKLAIKAFGYERYFDSGAFAIWNGATEEERDEYPFTPIFVLPNEERRNNTAEHLLRLVHPKTGARIRCDSLLLITHKEFLANPLGKSYITPRAYLRATQGTLYDPCKHKAASHVTTRDRLVAQRLEKVSLFDGRA